MRTLQIGFALGLVLATHLASAEVVIDWVTVGDPGNACDVQPQGCFGSVAEPYRIGMFEVTNGQYVEFLNAVAATDSNGLYSVNMADPSVTINEVDVSNEGRFYVGSKATNLGGGNWRYDYAVFNLNSHRSAGSFGVPFRAGTAVSNVSFRDVDYHSGEPYDNTDWTGAVGGSAVDWDSPATFAQNANTNALRWGTMYRYSFQADIGPGLGGVTIGLFRPGTPATVSSFSSVPCLVLGDINGDMERNGADIEGFVGCVMSPAAPANVGCGCADLDRSGSPDLADVVLLVNGLLSP